MRNKEELNKLNLLGEHKVAYPTDYAPQMLETFENKHPENEYVVTLNCPEFTTLCPKTGQPDFAKLVISYIPRSRMVESKSLKLYLFSFLFRHSGSPPSSMLHKLSQLLSLCHIHKCFARLLMPRLFLQQQVSVHRISLFSCRN